MSKHNVKVEALTAEEAKRIDKFADMQARDKNGEPIPAYPVSKRTKKDQRKTSVGYTVLAVLLHILAYLPIIAASAVLGYRCYELMPYYSFWPFVGVILAGVLGLVFMTVTLIVTRRKSKKSIRTQTIKVLITFVCLSTGFGLILTYVFPDVIAYATQSTIYCEDLYYNGESQAEGNAALERDLIMYNVLNGNLNKYNADGTIAEHGDYAYDTLVRMDAEGVNYINSEIQASYLAYLDSYSDIKSIETLVIEPMKLNERKYELYEFIYSYHVLNDYTYSFYNTVNRRAIALSVLDYVWKYSDYEQLLTEGFNNARFKALFDANYDSFNQDGYLTFDDPLLLYAQMSGRMTIPVVLRLILNEGWTYTQSDYNGVGDPIYNDDGNFMYQLYDLDTFEAYLTSKGVARNEDGTFAKTNAPVKKIKTKKDENGNVVKDENGNVVYDYDKNGDVQWENSTTKNDDIEEVVYAEQYVGSDGNPVFLYDGTITDQNGNELALKYGFNEDGWIIYENGVTKRPLNWLVLDMLGDPMALTTLDVGSLISRLGVPSTLLDTVLQQLPTLIESLGGLVKEDLGEVIEAASAGGNLTIGLCVDDDGLLAINLYPMNATYGMLGYMQATWVDSDNLLMAVINVVALRNWMVIFGAIGSVLVIGAGLLREAGQRTRKRTRDSRDRILTAKASK